MHGHFGIQRHILLTGATGYIGGSILGRLLSHPQSDSFRITVLVRDTAKASQFRSMGIHAVVGSYADLPLLEDLAADADLVIACVSAIHGSYMPINEQTVSQVDMDDLNAAKAILRGLKKRFQNTGQTPSLVHTSGTGVLSDNAQGMYPSETVYSDLDIKKLESLSITQPHRMVDVTIVNADKEGYVKTYIILPCTVYGIATGSLVDAGLQNPQSKQIPRLIKLGLDRGRAGMVGEGKNIWPNVHIHDVTDLYILIIDSIVPHRSHSHGHPDSINSTGHPQPEHGASGYYFAENGEHTLYALGEAIGQVMVSLKKSTEYTPTTLTEEEMQKYFPDGTNMGTNSRCRADRGRGIGWRPRKTTHDMLASIKQEFNFKY